MRITASMGAAATKFTVAAPIHGSAYETINLTSHT